MKKKLLKIFQMFIFIALGIFFIVYFWNKLNTEQQNKIFENFYKANYWWLILSVVAGFLSHVVRAARWNLMIATFNKPPKTFTTFWALMSGYLANLAVPRLGEVTRCALLSRRTKISFDKLLGSVVAERAFDLLLFIVLFIAAVIIFYDRVSSYLNDKILFGLNEKLTSLASWKLLIVFVAFIFFAAFVIFILRRFKENKLIVKVKAFLINVKNGLISVFKIRKAGLFILYTVLIWVFYWLMIYLAYFSFDATMHLSPQSAFVVLVFGTIGVIVVQGGIGIYPLIVSEILFLYGIDIVDGYSLGWLNWGVQTMLVVVLGLISFIVLSLAKNKEHELSKSDSK